MIEIFLFIHPLGKICFKEEQRLIRFVHSHPLKMNLQILPLVNMQSNQMVLAQYDNLADLSDRNTFFQTAYAVALDYKAVQLQGKRCARTFLTSIQAALLEEGQSYSSHLVEELLSQAMVDIDMFQEDRQSKLVIDKFWQDQKTARDLHVRQSASAVIFNFYREEDCGVLLKVPDAFEELSTLCHVDQKFLLSLN